MEGGGGSWKWCWIPVLPLHRIGAVGDGWAHKSCAPQRWQSLCHSSTPTSRLQSSDCACEHISGEILPPSVWKPNRTHACTFATHQNWHLSGFAFLLAVHMRLFSWTQRKSLRLNSYFSLNLLTPLAMGVGSWQTGSSEIVHTQIIILHPQKYSLFPFHASPFLSFSFYNHLFDIFTLWWKIASHRSHQQSKTIPIIAWFYLKDQQMLTFGRCCRVSFWLIYLPWQIQ